VTGAAGRTTADALVDRWNQIVKWHGDRQAVLGSPTPWCSLEAGAELAEWPRECCRPGRT